MNCVILMGLIDVPKMNLSLEDMPDGREMIRVWWRSNRVTVKVSSLDTLSLDSSAARHLAECLMLAAGEVDTYSENKNTVPERVHHE